MGQFWASSFWAGSFWAVGFWQGMGGSPFPSGGPGGFRHHLRVRERLRR